MAIRYGDGMDCRACAPTLAKKLARVPGVVTADVDYDAQLAIVSHDGTRDPTRDLLDAIEDLGYRGSPARH
jgi:P-type Cu+ transporter